ncbi:hypothetical protein [Streptomyces sp. NPDC021562]|uniref:hypothetical protein n=1 Tax=Streptomyces sp. NPDC021562 TaxID=3155121 RepID=UPI00104287A9
MTAHAPDQQAARTAVLTAPLDAFDPEIAAAIDAEPAARGFGTREFTEAADSVQVLTERFPLYPAAPRPVAEEAVQ